MVEGFRCEAPRSIRCELPKLDWMIFQTSVVQQTTLNTAFPTHLSRRSVFCCEGVLDADDPADNEISVCYLHALHSTSQIHTWGVDSHCHRRIHDRHAFAPEITKTKTDEGSLRDIEGIRPLSIFD